MENIPIKLQHDIVTTFIMMSATSPLSISIPLQPEGLSGKKKKSSTDQVKQIKPTDHNMKFNSHVFEE